MKYFYVAKNGCDQNPGTAELPFASLQAARDAVRQLVAKGLDEPVTVQIGSGNYRMPTLFLDAQDSGTEACPITYRGEGKVVLNGGLSLTAEDFAPLTPEERLRIQPDARDHVMRIDLTAMGLTEKEWGKMCAIGDKSTAPKYDSAVLAPMWCEVIVNDQRMTIARYPNEGYLRTLEPVKEGICYENMNGARFTKAQWATIRNPEGDIQKIDPETAKRVATWKSLKDVWVFGYPQHMWADAASPVTAIDTETGEMKTEYVSYYGLRADAPYYFYNVLEELDAPGEYYLDRDTGVLYLYAPENLAEAQIELTLLPTPLISGQNISHLRFENLTVINTRDDGLHLQGQDLQVQGCVIKNVGGHAAIIDGTCCKINQCEVSHTGRGGITLRGGDRKTLTPSQNEVTNCEFFCVAEMFRNYQPAVFLGGVGVLCAHNHMHDIEQMAIGFKGNNHVIEYNNIHHVCYFANDMGAIYSGRDYTTRGNIIRYNFFHDIHSSVTEHINVIYCDDALGSCIIEKNVFLRCAIAVFFHGGHDMVFTNNLIIDKQPDAEWSMLFDRYAGPGDLYNDDLPHPESDHWRWANFERQEDIWAAAYPHLAEYTTWDPIREQMYPHYCNVTNNLFVNHCPIRCAFDVYNIRYQNKYGNNLELPSLNGKMPNSYMLEFEELPYEQMGIALEELGLANARKRYVVSETLPYAFRSFEEALAAAKSQEDCLAPKQAIEIAIDGMQPLKKTIRIRTEDLPSAKHPVFVTGENSASGFSGGLRVTGFTPWKDNIWRVQVPEIAYTRHLYIDGVSAKRPATESKLKHNSWDTPDDGEFEFYESGIATTHTEIQNWKNTRDLEMIYDVAWVHRIIPIESVKPMSDGRLFIQPLEPAFQSSIHAEGVRISGSPNYIENVFELLGKPLEWYFDRTEQMLYVGFAEGDSPENHEIVVPALEQLFEIVGTLDAPVYHLNFQNLQFAYTTCLFPHKFGCPEIQATQMKFSPIPPELVKEKPYDGDHYKIISALRILAAKDVSFEDCTFTALGTGALQYEFGAQDSRIVGNHFHQIGGSAVTLGDFYPERAHHPEDRREIVRSIRVLNNYIHDTGVDFKGAAAIHAGYVQDVNISHNEIREVSYTAISLGWGWGESDICVDERRPTPWTEPTVCVRNQVAYNHIHRCMMKLCDGGAIYTLGCMTGTSIIGNYIHESAGFQGDGFPRFLVGGYQYERFYDPIVEQYDRVSGMPGGIYLDEGTQNVEVCENILHDVPIPLNFNNQVNEGWTRLTIRDNVLNKRPSDADFPWEIAESAGLEPAYRNLIE